MSVTVRQQIVTAVEAALGAIAVAAGYRTDAGATLQAWRTRPVGQAEARPALTVRDPSAALGATAYGTHQHRLTLEVAAVTDGETAAETLRDVATDVLAALGVDPTWGGLAETTEPASVVLEVERDGLPVGGVTVTATITYETALWAF